MTLIVCHFFSLCLCVSLFFFHSLWLFFGSGLSANFLSEISWSASERATTVPLLPFYICLCSVLYSRLLAAPCLVMARHVSYLFKCHLSGLSCAFYGNIFELYERENESTFVIFLFKPLRCPPSPFSLLLSSLSLAVSLPRSLSGTYKLSEVFHN